PVCLARRARLTGVQRLQRDAALDQLLLEDLQGRLGPILGLRLDRHRVLAGMRDLRPGAPEVEPRGDLLRRLIERVVELLVVDLADDVERGICHVTSPVCEPGTDAPTVPVCAAPMAYRYPYLRCRAPVRR